MSRVLEGRVAVVIGAGSSGGGLSNGSSNGVSNGEAATLAYADAGAAVAVVDRNPDEAHRVAAVVEKRGGIALPVTADISSEDDVMAAVAAIVAEFGAPHVLHNNVGIVHLGSIIDTGTEAWNTSIAVNLTGTYLTCRHILPHMLSAGRGVITNVSSVAAIRDTGYVYPAYSATKAAVNQLTVSLALTYAAQGIRVNALLPGLIDTPLAQLLNDPQALAARHARSPTGRMGSPYDVANAAVFLASDHASYINAVCLPVDGGLSARCG
ncbi:MULTISPECIES: SDR family NAD(P)-dependent oxidoreductase [unclassified Kribbella]|uniref:SDR family NAD(P)-dependent oxidoreductase n=1 Tax=unclassified Kribbella TaxID=2644121 RepID=UPI003077B02B